MTIRHICYSKKVQKSMADCACACVEHRAERFPISKLFSVLILPIFALSACLVIPPSRSVHVHSAARTAAYGAVGGAVVGAVTGGFGVPAGLAIGGIAGTVVGYDSQRAIGRMQRIQYQLQHQDVQIICTGETVRMIVPADQIYYDNSPRIKWDAHPLINLIAAYLQYFDTTTIQVGVFTDNAGHPKRNLALSQERASNMVDYISTHPMDTRIIYAHGYGDAQPIAHNTSKRGRTVNRRVEFSFQWLGIHQTPKIA